MPFWKREKQAAFSDELLPDTPRVAALGQEPCLRRGCRRQDAVQCGYIDRRSRTCTTTLCRDHHVVVMGQVFCPRHAGIMNALLQSPKKGHLPAVENRAPSLANWIGDDIDPRIRQILHYVRDKDGSETIIVEPIGYVFSANDRTHRWERSWKLADHTGVTLKVSVDVDESLDSVVRVRVGQRDVTRVIPPWIERHTSNPEAPDDDDVRERAEFYERLCQSVNDAVVAYRHAAGLRPYIGDDQLQQESLNQNG